MDIPNRLNYDQPPSAPLPGHMPHGGHHMTPYGALYDRDPNIMDGGVDSKRDISDILQQIMTITDQSLDEAQARLMRG